MAKTKGAILTNAPETEPIETAEDTGAETGTGTASGQMADVVDIILGKLNEMEIEFARDAWENKAPEEYGVVELAEQSAAIYADDIMIDEAWTIRVHLYVKGDDDAWPDKVGEKLRELSGPLDLTWRVTGREFAYEVGKVHWTWTVTRWGPLRIEGDPHG